MITDPSQSVQPSALVRSRPDKPERLADLESVFREHHGFVWRTLHHFGLRGDMVKDAVQEVFLVVHRRLPDYDGRTAMKNWLYGIARRVASDARKKQARRRARLQLVPDPNASSHSGSFERLSAAEIVGRFLDVLDEGKRQVFVLAEVEGMTAPEIADVLGLNVNTTYARLRAARSRFQREVERQRARQKREAQCTR